MNAEFDYLWTGEAPVDVEVAQLERELESLRWTHRPLELPAREAQAPSTKTRPPLELAPREQTREARVIELPRRDRGWWPALAAGLAVAAAVFGVILALRAVALQPPAPDEAAPAGSPSPDLKDPFAPDDGDPAQSGDDFERPGRDAPSLVDPFGDEAKQPPAPRRLSPDLKDPFADSPASQPPKPKRRSRSKSGERRLSPDLKDPFAPDDDDDGSQDQADARDEREPGKLYDPFSGEARETPKHAPDLRDPFGP